MYIEEIKNQGKINIEELSIKQIIALVSFWKLPATKKQVSSFSEMLDRCYKSSPWHKNAAIIYLDKDGQTATSITHSFVDMYESEEEMVINAILKNNH